jgi:PEP-CTERM motif
MRVRQRFGVMVLALVALTLLLGGVGQANASIIVAPNSNTSSAGNAVQFGVLDTPGDNVTFQYVYSATQFSTLTPGDEITGIGFRLPAGSSTFNSALVYSSFSLQIGQSTAAPGALSTTFAANQASDTVTAFSGPLTIPAGSFVGGAGPNPFYELAFATPYTYTGGNLLVTIRHSDVSSSISVDANTISGFSSVTDTAANFGSDNATQSDGQRGFYNSPVTAFYFSPVAPPPTVPVPEPSSLALLSLGLGLAGWRRWRKRTAV